MLGTIPNFLRQAKQPSLTAVGSLTLKFAVRRTTPEHCKLVRAHRHDLLTPWLACTILPSQGIVYTAQSKSSLLRVRVSHVPTTSGSLDIY